MAYKVGRCLLSHHLRRIGMTPQELASRLHMPISQISDYCNDRKIMGLKNAKSIASVVGCTIDELYEWVLIKPTERKRSRHRQE